MVSKRITVGFLVLFSGLSCQWSFGQASPVAVNDNVVLDEDTNIQISAFSNDTDPDGDLDPSSLIIISDASNGITSVDPLTGIITYVPNLNYFGVDQIVYQISDQAVPANTAEATINIIVNPVNDAPTSADNTVFTDEDVTYNFMADDILYNDVDGDCFNGFIIVTPLNPDIGELFYNGNPVALNTLYFEPDLLSFVPDPGISGVTEFDFRVVDDQGTQSIDYTMTIVIKDVNDLPSSADIEITMDANTVYTFASNQLIYSDPEGDLFAGFIITQLPSDGQLLYNDVVANTNTLYTDFSLVSFEPATDESGMPYTTFLFIVRDDRGGDSEDYTVTINVRELPAQEPPTLIISEGFSPNADFINDYWHIEGIDFYKNNEVVIYNRWGNPVRTIEGYSNESNPWRGESDHSAFGTKVPVGSYFYVIKLGDGSAPIQGYVVLNQ
ncbi:tandem-95 repeat protein [Fulvivirga sedimenti]|uniref:Tandem-95 repeat protein n=1 Tax=Fulvivirga sedimenti TaxID=2879465 RepID=A0A9X1HV69_9BACT|nr:tandem-95 repeat protein [Fulvivirga sedimenti]MCA6078501.1 tandem-95 repeat protein [Fulvivirga sedimenti]